MRGGGDTPMEITDVYEINAGRGDLKQGELAERVIEEVIVRRVGPGDHAIDGGAADGRFTDALLRVVGPHGRVYSFEPIPQSFRKLAARYRDAPVELFEACIFDQEATSVRFNYVPDRRWVSGLRTSSDLGIVELAVAQTTIDATVGRMVEDAGRSRVTFIKLDIEGAEYRAMMGARDLIRRDRPIVIFENGLSETARTYGYTKEDFFALFEALEYDLFDIFGAPVTPEAWDGVGSRLAWNFIAISKHDVSLSNFGNEHADAVASVMSRRGDWRTRSKV
jgi:FkbM family methyltransferase